MTTYFINIYLIFLIIFIPRPITYTSEIANQVEAINYVDIICCRSDVMECERGHEFVNFQPNTCYLLNYHKARSIRVKYYNYRTEKEYFEDVNCKGCTAGWGVGYVKIGDTKTDNFKILSAKFNN